MRFRWYVGHKAETMWAFRSKTTPTEASHGKQYNSVVGPFRTKRAAVFFQVYAHGNPHCYTVAQAEVLAAKCAKLGAFDRNSNFRSDWDGKF